MPSRGGLFDSEKFIGEVAEAGSTRTPSMAGLSLTQSQPLRGLSSFDCTAEGTILGIGRPETPILAYVDRASMPGYVDPDERDHQAAQLVRDLEWQRTSRWNVPATGDAEKVPSLSQAGDPDDEYEKDLLAWKRLYGCSEEEVGSEAAAGRLAESEQRETMGSKQDAPEFHQPRELGANADISSSELVGDRPVNMPADTMQPRQPTEDEVFIPRASVLDVDISTEQATRKSLVAKEDPLPDRPGTPEKVIMPRASMVDVDIDIGAATRMSMVQQQDTLPERPATPEKDFIPRGSVLDVDIEDEETRRKSMFPLTDSMPPRPANPEKVLIPRASMVDVDIGDEERTRRSQQLQPGFHGDGIPTDQPPRPATPEKVSMPTESILGRKTPDKTCPGESLGQEPLQTCDVEFDPTHGPLGLAVAPTTSDPSSVVSVGVGDHGAAAMHALVPVAPPSAPPAEAGRPPPSSGRRYEYTAKDLEVATEIAKTRVKPDGTWRSEHSETGLQKRDFLLDLRRQREKDKGRQAVGPLWVHLATQAKNLANCFDLVELLEVLKLFCSVRYEDYELYMRFLGEVPHFIKQATADQLCELIRLLARRRLRERNYVDMVAAHLLQKIRITDDSLPARQLVKTANAFAALECRSNPKFVEHFLRHIEHRIEELDAASCCCVSPAFVANYMTDALRRAYLIRCAETQAAFQGPLEDARNVACTELILRKEHHSFVVSLPTFVLRYLEKVRQHAQFDKWGTVSLPAVSAPDGPKGSQRAEMSLQLQRKASTATGGARADVFSSDMHKDVSACLTHLGIEHENGVLCGPYLLDIVALDMVTPSRRIVYEVNSPHNFYEATQQLVAEQKLRHRMLGRLGQKLHMVNAEEWKVLSAAQKMTFMLKMQQAQQEENAKEAKQQAAANTMRAPVNLAASSGPEPLRLKSIRDLSVPIRVPVPPSQKARQRRGATLSAR